MKKWALTVAMIAALVGAAFSVVSTVQHIRILQKGLEEQSFCVVSDKINCDIVNASSYSEIFGIPTAWWGLCFYAAIGVMAAAARFSRRDRRASVAAAWFISIGGLAFSLWLGYISAVVLGVWCIECIGMYAANLVLFVFLFAALDIPLGGVVRFVVDYVRAVFGRQSNLGFAPKIVSHVIAVAVIFLVGWGAMASIQGKARKGETRASLDEKINAFYMQSLHDIKVSPDWPVWGNPKAPVTIVEFSEFQCPFCRMAAFSVKPFLQEFRNDVAFYFVNYPLDNACNDELKMPMHKYACLTSKASVCAQERGDFWGFHDDLFRNQRQLSEATVLKLAERHGWDRDEFLACINSPETDKRVRADIAAARAIYVNGTPSIFIDGRKLRYWRDPKFLQAVVKEEIKRAKETSNTNDQKPSSK